MSVDQVIVIGGGAAGMMAAGQAALMGAEVILIEKKDVLGRKIRISGKGRCNLTNDQNISEFIRNYPGNGRFLQGALREFDNVRLRQFFADWGVETKVERGGRVFPESDDAQIVVKALEKFLHKAEVKVRTSCTVEEILVENGQVKRIRLASGENLPASAVIVCTGGASSCFRQLVLPGTDIVLRASWVIDRYPSTGFSAFMYIRCLGKGGPR